MNELQRPDPFLVADNTALDFLNSICAPWGDDIEWLENGDDLVSWLHHAELISDEERDTIYNKLSNAELDDAAERARNMREWFRGFIKKYAGKEVTANVLKELKPLNDLLRGDRLYHQVGISEDAHSGFEFHEIRHWHKADDLLAAVASEMGRLICESDFGLIKNCEGPTCTLWFLDISKNHKRRWCSMAVCGNRAKAAAYRAKKQQP
ncbi:CGNR zinc finger domain-containing protein [Sessilibacter sp. MAH2]